MSPCGRNLLYDNTVVICQQRTLCSRLLLNLGQVSFSGSVRLKIFLPSVESGSTQKYPTRSNWKRSPGLAPASEGSNLASLTISSELGLRLSRTSWPSSRSYGSGLRKACRRGGFRQDGVRGRDPVHRRLDLAAVGRLAAAAQGIVGAVDFNNVAGGVFHDILRGDEIGVAQANFFAGARGGNTWAEALRGNRPARYKARARKAPGACRLQGLRGCSRPRRIRRYHRWVARRDSCR